MKKTFFTCFFLGMSVLPTLSKTYDKVDVLERPVPISSIKDIKGFFGYRMEVNRNYLKDFPIDKYVDFVVQRQHTAWDWTKAEQHGKWIESAYLSGIQRNDKALLDKARTMLKRIVDSQEESGYVGATSKDYRSETGKEPGSVGTTVESKRAAYSNLSLGKGTCRTSDE